MNNLSNNRRVLDEGDGEDEEDLDNVDDEDIDPSLVA